MKQYDTLEDLIASMPDRVWLLACTEKPNAHGVELDFFTAGWQRRPTVEAAIHALAVEGADLVYVFKARVMHKEIKATLAAHGSLVKHESMLALVPIKRN